MGLHMNQRPLNSLLYASETSCSDMIKLRFQVSLERTATFGTCIRRFSIGTAKLGIVRTQVAWIGEPSAGMRST